MSGFNAQNFSVEGIRDGRQNGSLSLSEDFGFVTRVDWTPELVPGFLLGGSFYVGDSGQDVEVAGGEVPDARLWIFEGHTQYQNGPSPRARAVRVLEPLGRARADQRALGRSGVRRARSPTRCSAATPRSAYDVYPWLFGDEDHQLEPFARVEYVDTQYDVPSGFDANRDQAVLGLHGWEQLLPAPERRAEVRVSEPRPARAGGKADEVASGMGYAF